MNFFGREHELKDLHRFLTNKEQHVSLVFGRRRIGKSELIKKSLQETDIVSIYFECKQTTEENNVDSLALLLSEAFHFPKPNFPSLEKLLDFLFEKEKQEKF